MAYFTKFKKAFLNTRFNSRFWKCFVLQIILLLFAFLIISTIGISFYSAIMKVYVAAGGLSNIISSMSNPSEILKIAYSQIPFIALVLVLGVLIHFVISFLFQSFIWKSAVKKEWSFGYFIKIILLSILFWIMFSLISLIFVFAAPISESIELIIIALFALFFFNSFIVSKITLARFPEKGFWFSMYKGFASSLTFWRLLPAAVYFIILTGIFALISSLFSSSIINVQQIINNSITLLFNFKPILALLKDISIFIIISSIIWAFFVTYMRIFYAEYNIEEQIN